MCFTYKKVFIHLKDFNCGHYHVQASVQFSHIDCYACLKHIEDNAELKNKLIFEEIEKGLHQFMEENANHPTAEYYIPDIVTAKIQSKEIAFSVIPTNDNWFGVTYKEDKQMAIDTLNKHINNGVYPKSLWS